MSEASPAEVRAAAAAERDSFSAIVRDRWDAFKAGDVGSLPVIVGIILITAFFTSKTNIFFTAVNFSNLIGQMAGVTVIAVGVVFVLLIGEIDLSIGSVTGVCAVSVAYFAQPQTGHTVPGWVAILITLGLGLLIGAINGVLRAIVGVPSFVVTLSGLLIYLGVIVRWIGSQATIPIQDRRDHFYDEKRLPTRKAVDTMKAHWRGKRHLRKSQTLYQKDRDRRPR